MAAGRGEAEQVMWTKLGIPQGGDGMCALEKFAQQGWRMDTQWALTGPSARDFSKNRRNMYL